LVDEEMSTGSGIFGRKRGTNMGNWKATNNIVGGKKTPQNHIILKAK
jgi:hypothetical protein